MAFRLPARSRFGEGRGALHLFFLSSPKQIIFSATCHIAVFPLLDPFGGAKPRPLGRGVKFRSGSTLRLLVSNKDNFHNIIFEIDRRINFGMVKLILIKAFSKDKNPDRTILKNLGKVLRVEAKPILSRAASL